MNLDHVHHNSIERNQKDRYLKYRTLEIASRPWRCGSLRFDAKEANKFPPHILMIDSSDISDVFDNHNRVSPW